MKFDIKSMLPEELSRQVVQMGIPAFRAKQIFEWLSRGTNHFDEMLNLPKSLRLMLAERCEILNAEVARRFDSALDNTSKFLLRLHDGETVEAVMMSYKHGISLCISTQAGCRMGCAFCASTKSGLIRHLAPSEMLSEIHAAEKSRGVRVGSLVLMGVGEPLDNIDHVLQFLRLVSHPDGQNLGMRHISVSTCGLVDQIRRLAEAKNTAHPFGVPARAHRRDSREIDACESKMGR